MSAIDDANTALATAQGAQQRRDALIALAAAALDQLAMHPPVGVLRPESCAQRADAFERAVSEATRQWSWDTGIHVEPGR